MSGLKLIAIKPLKGCDPNYLKILKPNCIYYLLNNYKINASNIRHAPTIGDLLYNNQKLSINVSAIVGKNGSGKSSLVELLIRVLNNLSGYFKINQEIDLQTLPNLKVELYFKSDSYYKISVTRTVSIYKQSGLLGKFKKIKRDQFDNINFFYSVIVNYSHYGLNSKEVGNWIDNLFHKNDGYQVPVVLNPMRKEGNIDINTENSLIRSRLIANILKAAIITQDRSFKITKNLYADNIKLKLQQRDDSVVYRYTETIHKVSKGTYKEYNHEIRFSELNIKHNEILGKVNSKFNFGFKGRWEGGDLIMNLAHRYIIRKLVKIATTYPFYQAYFNFDNKCFNLDKFDEFLTLVLHKNANHISFKLKQTLNFLRYKHFKYERNGQLNVRKLAEKIESIIKENGLENDSVIELIPPPIFEIDIKLRPIDNEKKAIYFNTLSSGEKQFIYSINSILYHLINLDSIRYSRIQKNYKYVNLVLEEIELYFHPEMQREFLDFLLNRISEFNFKSIEGLSICLVTHSPFILSDIPNTNILFLNEKGLPIEKAIAFKTFGANIHDLLANSFFLSEGVMGKFAKRKIEEAIEDLNKNPGGNKIKIIQELINIIGEPIIRNRFQDIFDEKVGKDSISLIQQKNRLKKELSEVETLLKEVD